MIFRDRKDAGQKLALELSQYKNDLKAIILGLPRGGVVVAFEIARTLSLPLDVIVIRKIGAPGNPELAMGAIDDEGNTVLNQNVLDALHVNEASLNQEKQKEQKEAFRRLKLYRGKRPRLNLKEKIAILVDDGLATGATMHAAINSAKAKGAKEIIVAIPVAAPESLEKIKSDAHHIFCLHAPSFFGAVGNFYEIFDQTSNEEVIALLKPI